MDTALVLRQTTNLIDDERLELLSQSQLLKTLTTEMKEKPLYAIWRIIALSEIPCSEKLEYTIQLVYYVKQNVFAGDGFSFTGSKEDIVPCYNAMVLEALCKLGYAHSDEVRKAVEWIKTHQFFHRGGTTSWQGKGIHNYGGCLKNTPCYIGIAKTLKALLHYQNISQINDPQLDNIIAEATDYVKKHNFCYRLSNGEPISKHILEPAFPTSYVLNIVELLEIAYLTHNINHPSSERMIEHLKTIQNDKSGWGVGYQYKSDGFVSFDGGRKNADWITFVINSFLA